MSGADVELANVLFRYRERGTEVNMLFDLAVPAGDRLAIIGPSGAGKSTLLSLIAGFDRPVSGVLRIGGVDMAKVDPAQRPVSMLFQDNNLFAHLDIWTNIALGVSGSLSLAEGDRQKIETSLVRVGLAGYQRRLPGELSGGERQRVALARALVRNRPVLLLDEPFAALGPAQRKAMLGLVTDLQKETKVTLLIVTHQPEDARGIAGRTAFLYQGRILAVRPTAELLAADDIPELRAYLG